MGNENAGDLVRIGRYAVLRKLGEGAMGVVYAAYDEDLDRKVAIKVVHPAQQQDPDVRLRMVREAQALARVSAPNVIQVYEVGELADQMYIVMEFVRGTTLTSWQSAQPRTWQQTLLMYCAAGQGLLAAHEAGLTHRDFKPDNVLVGSDDRPRVADFGLARVAGAPEREPVNAREQDASVALAATIESGPGLTQAGVSLGTPLYMSPEQHQGKPADGRSDQFSFCVALYEALYNSLPFEGKNQAALRYNVLTGMLRPRPSDSAVPLRVHQALVRGLSVAPDQRFPSMRELLSELHFDEEHDPAAVPAARRLVTVALSAACVAYCLALWAQHLLGTDPLRAAARVSCGFLLAISLLAVWSRRMLMANVFHRTMIMAGVVFSSQLAGERCAGLLMGLTAQQVFTIDLISMASLSLLISVMVLRTMWPLCVVLIGSAALTISRPQLAVLFAYVVIPATVLIAIVLWNRAGISKPKPG